MTDKKSKPSIPKGRGALCCPTRIRTWTDRTKIWSAAITPLDNLSKAPYVHWHYNQSITIAFAQSDARFENAKIRLFFEMAEK